MRRGVTVIGSLLAAASAAACADWDNPTALAELNPEARFEIASAEVETFEEVEIHVEVSERGSALTLAQAELEIEHAATGAVSMAELAAEGDGYATHVTFYEPGEHHIHLHGMPEGHGLSVEMGEHEIEVHRHHTVIGPYRVEIEVSPAPIREGQEAHIHILVFEREPDGEAGAPVSGLDIEMAVHDLDGAETPLTIAEEEAGEYEAAYGFGAAGTYELHVEVDVGGAHEEGEFHLPVLSLSGDDGQGEEEGGDHGHGH